MNIRKTYDRERLPFSTTGESLTHQSMAPECDINRIMAKWQKTGVIEHANNFNGDYGDFSEVPTYQEAMNKVIRGQEVFMTLPSSVRKQFDNDPHQFLEFATDARNTDEMVDMGLMDPPFIEQHRPLPDTVKTASKAEKKPSETDET
ncbi:internal scaffolding protein [Microviridae sp.]|nr:internal scaffolding protein [Microviridae sp.]